MPDRPSPDRPVDPGSVSPVAVNLASDNVAGASPEVVEALARAAGERAMPYGDDPWTERLEALFAQVFERPVTAFPVATGTAANALALACLAPPWGVVYCHEEAHVQVDECGAPELFTGGAKLLPLPGDGAKIEPATLAAAISGAGDVHHAQPAAVSLSQATERGRTFSPEETGALVDVCRRHGLRLHVDGARFANAVAGTGASPAELTWKSGVDVLSFGATKNGCLAAEAVVFFDEALAADLPYRRKRGGHLVSKMRFVSAQLVAYLSDELWLRNAAHANRLAARLGAGLVALPGVELLAPVEANEVFARLPRQAMTGLREDGFVFYDWDSRGGVDDDTSEIRLVPAFDTAEEDVEEFLSAAGLRLGAAEAG